MPSLETLPPKEIARALYSAGTATQSSTVPIPAGTTEQVSALLLDICTQEQQKRNNYSLRFILLKSLTIFVFTWLGIWGGTRLGGYPLLNPWLPAIMGVINSLIIGLANIQMPASKQQQSAVAALANIAPDGPRTLAALIDTLPRFTNLSLVWYFSNWNAEYGQTLKAITTPLWNAGEGLSLVLTESRSHRLRGMVRALWNQPEHFTADQADFCAAAIRFLVRTGDTQSVFLLQQIAKSKKTDESRAFLRSLVTEFSSVLQTKASENKAAYEVLVRLLKRDRAGLDKAALQLWIDSNAVGVMQNAFQAYLEKSLWLKRIVGALSLLAGIGIYFLLSTFVERGNLSKEIPTLLKFIVLLFLLGRFDKLRAFFMRWFDASGKTIAYCADKIADEKLLPVLIDTLRDQPSKELRGAVIQQVFRLKPGDGIYFAPRHRAFFRRIIWRQLRFETDRAQKTGLLSASIYALGILADEKAEPLLTQILEGKRKFGSGTRGKALDALR